jgi:ADP-ribose pyrophosphatase YjhB (NUDIX family)
MISIQPKRKSEGMESPHWIHWAREIQALAQTGAYYAVNEFQSQRYHRLMEIAAEIVVEHSNLEYSMVVEAFTTPKGYSTPRVDVRGAVFKDRRLLLVRERTDGGWTLPGGWADVGDVPSLAAEREVWEEAGYHVKARKVVGVYDANRFGDLELFHAFKIIFLCDLIDGESTPSLETSEVAFFDLKDLPGVLSSERTNMRHISDVFSALDNPDCATIFD